MLKNVLIAITAGLLLLGCSGEEDKGKSEAQDESSQPIVFIETELGTIKLELWPDVAPNHVANFLDLVNSGFYTGLTWHRVIKGFVIQSGDPNADGSGNAGYVIPEEFSGLPHNPGTLSMARGHEYNSASCQFFICLARRPDLDGQYTIFGRTIEGLDVVKKIGKTKTDKKEKPLEDIHVLKIWQEGKEPVEAPSDREKAVDLGN
ncbi:MAG: peptidylprolyl isomerase [candidate division Zixibacteria bacterium]|nr:peptidylprolyl isomerase [candidate division Zixibacteria bacterium]